MNMGIANYLINCHLNPDLPFLRLRNNTVKRSEAVYIIKYNFFDCVGV